MNVPGQPAAAAPPGTPLNAPLCPLCGQPNACAAVACGRFDVDCWCRSLSFSRELLARVPAAQAGRACICRACAEAAAR